MIDQTIADALAAFVNAHDDAHPDAHAAARTAWSAVADARTARKDGWSGAVFDAAEGNALEAALDAQAALNAAHTAWDVVADAEAALDAALDGGPHPLDAADSKAVAVARDAFEAALDKVSPPTGSSGTA